MTPEFYTAVLRLAREGHGENRQALEDPRRPPLFNVGDPFTADQGSERVEDDEAGDAGVEGDRGRAERHKLVHVSQQTQREHHERTGPFSSSKI